MTSSRSKAMARSPDLSTQPAALARSPGKAARSAQVLHHIACMGSWVSWAIAGFAALMRKPDALLDQTLVDKSTGLLNRDGFMLHGARLLNECHRRKRPVTVAVFGCDDLLTIRRMYGRKAAHESLKRMVGKVTGIAGRHGLTSRTGQAEFTVMLPGLGREKALQAIARQLGNPMRIEFESGNEEIVMVPTLVVEAPGAAETSIESLYAEMSADLQGLILGARSPAVSHQAAAPPTAVRRPAPVMQEYLPEDRQMPNLPPTMPVALGAH